MDNLLFGPDAQINHTIGLLRATATDQPLADKIDLLPGVFLAIDTEEGEVTGRCVTGGVTLLRMEYTVSRSPRWLALHMAVGDVDLSKAAVMGIVCKSRAAEAATYRVCLRSATSSGFVDAFLPKHVVAFSEASTHIDLLKLEGYEHVPAKAEWRELILFFQPRSAAFELLDLRAFIV